MQAASMLTGLRLGSSKHAGLHTHLVTAEKQWLLHSWLCSSWLWFMFHLRPAADASVCVTACRYLKRFLRDIATVSAMAAACDTAAAAAAVNNAASAAGQAMLHLSILSPALAPTSMPLTVRLNNR